MTQISRSDPGNHSVALGSKSTKSMLSIPEEIIIAFIKDLKSKVNEVGERIYSDEQIVQMIEKLDKVFSDKKFLLLKKDSNG